MPTELFPPTGLSVSGVGVNYITIYWSSPVDGNVDGYKTYQDNVHKGTTNTGTADRQWTFDNLSGAKEYTLGVSTTYGPSESGKATIKVTTLDALNPVTGVTISSTLTDVGVRWVLPTKNSNVFSKYVIKYYNGGTLLDTIDVSSMSQIYINNPRAQEWKGLSITAKVSVSYDTGSSGSVSSVAKIVGISSKPTTSVSALLFAKAEGKLPTRLPGKGGSVSALPIDDII